MKRIRILKGKVGLLYRKGDYKKVLTQGVYWLYPFDRVFQYDLSKPFNPAVELNLLLEDDELVSMLEIVDVLDSQIVFVFENGIFSKVLSPGRYAFWKGLVDYRFVKADLSKVEIDEPLDPGLFENREVYAYLRVFVVESYEKGLLFIDGNFNKVLDQGTYYFWKNSIPVKVLKVDTRMLQLEIPGQEILTRDKAALRINYVLRYMIVDAKKALMDSKDYEKQLYMSVQMVLREYIGSYTLDELLEKKESISDYVMKSLEDKTPVLGIKVMSSGIRDVILPGEVKDIMNQVLVAQKKAQANVIMRREETASTRSLLNTAKLMEDNEMLFKLKEMEYVEKIADKIGEITVTGNGDVVSQLRSIFAPSK